MVVLKKIKKNFVYLGKDVQTESIERPNNSKSSVVVLYQGEQSSERPETFAKQSLEDSKSIRSSLQSSDITSDPSSFLTKIPIESTESSTPRYSIPRKKITSRRYLRVTRQQTDAFNVNIYHKSKVMQVTPSMRNYWTTTSKNRCEEKVMKQSMLSPSLNFLMQHMQTSSKDITKEQVCFSTNEINESKRVFPFQPTPSGNLKVIPNQVVFESKKVSVLVADPRHTKVNVKAELDKSNIDVNRSISDFSTRQGFIDLPPGVTPSAINHLQVHKKLADIPVKYKPRTQPYKTKVHQSDMEKNESIQQTTSHEVHSMHEVPLSSLGLMQEEPIDWGNVILPDKTDLYQELARRITNYKNADCIVRIGQDEFHCHLLVLQSYSTFFDEKNSKEIDLTESTVTSKAFSIIYDWMISPTSESCHLLRRDNILEIFTSAQYLGIKELEEQCWAFIDNDELFSENTAFLLYMEAKKINNTAVMELMVPRIMKFFLILVSTKDFLELSVEELCLLLKSNYICVNSEMEVLMSAVRWLMHDWEYRKKYMLEVLKCVRFGLIAPWQLVDVKRNPENPEFIELMSYPEVQKMVDDGLAFVIIKYWYGNQTEDYYHWIDLLGLIEPTNRNWAGEDKNYVTYREFLLYLEEYQKTKISELKFNKQQTKSSLCNSLNKDYHRQPICQQSHCNRETLKSSGQGSCCPQANVGKTSKYCTPKVSPCSYIPAESSTGLMMTPEMLNMYLNNLDRNNGKVVVVSKSPTDCLQNATNRRNNNEIQQFQQEDSLIKKSLKKCKKAANKYSHDKIIYSSKSEEDAATTIQATYRGYKVRRKYDEIKKTSSEEKQNAKHLSTSIGQKIYEPLKPIKISNSLMNENIKENGLEQGCSSPRKKEKDNLRNQSRLQYDTSETLPNQKQPMKTSYNNLSYSTDPSKLIKTIKSPTFFSNCDEITNSFSHSDKTEPDDSFSPRTCTISTNTCNNATVKNNFERNGTRYQSGDNTERCLTKSKEIQTRVSNYTRPLPQRLSNSILGSNIEGCFLDNSLFYPDRESILIFGGVDPHEEFGHPGATGKDIYRFKPDENLWEFVGEIPEPRHHHSVVYLKGRIYLVGGADPRENNFQRKSIIVGTVWSYDPTTRVWYNEDNMLTPRKNFVLVVSHGKMFAIGGQDKNGIALRSAESFDPTESIWREIQPMYTARIGAAGIKYRDFIWVAGGMTKSKKELFSRNVECYDPVHNSWLKIEPLNSPRCFATLYVISDCLYIIGGASTTENSTDSVDCIDIWDPHLCVWKEEAKMSIARHGHCTASIGAQLLIIGGVTTVFMKTLSSVECYCCEQGKWIKGVSPLPYAISGHSTVTLPPANLLVNS
ncbi:PREDICTED: uncharacterized protein LOC107066343 [Polistes dominula]|uniref:Uncharacterized protein LOC107066343 n=1 Tax=Polistes dominula TaxID=743375 RepID=A0ABM1I830_POLDO|nr:PREDICTED: uncharacterized protein LOC107066343 [Polistes dominula]